MKRRNLVRHLEQHGCAQRSSAVPRHREVNEFLARKICRDLEVPEP